MRCAKKFFKYSFGDGNYSSANAWNMLPAGTVETNDLVQEALPAIHSVSMKRTHNLPTEMRTLPLIYRRPSQTIFSNGQGRP